MAQLRSSIYLCTKPAYKEKEMEIDPLQNNQSVKQSQDRSYKILTYL